MENRVLCKDVKDHVGKEILVCGFVQRLRAQAKHKFILLRDFSGLVQCISFHGDSCFDELNEVTNESVVSVSGVVKEEKQAPGGFEIKVSKLEVLSSAEALPIQVIEKNDEEADLSKRLNFRWVDLRKEKNSKVFKVWSALEKGFRYFFDKENFIQIYTPSLTGSESESGAGVFEVKYFDKFAYLAQSPQFYKQMAMASGFDRVFCVGPVFRAERSNTNRHLTEFTGWDFEVSYIKDVDEIINLEKEMLISGFKFVKEDGLIDFELSDKDFHVITFEDAKKLLKDNDVKGIDGDFNGDEEKALCNLVKEKHGADFVFVKDYPIEKRPFYHMRYEDNDKLTKSFDLMYKGMEVTTGSIREHRVDVLLKQAKEKNIDVKDIEDYLNFFRYGCPPHGGGGIGPGRIIMKLCDLSNVKEAVFTPRDVDRLNP